MDKRKSRKRSKVVKKSHVEIEVDDDENVQFESQIKQEHEDEQICNKNTSTSNTTEETDVKQELIVSQNYTPTIIGPFYCNQCIEEYEGYCCKCSTLSHILNNICLVKSEWKKKTIPLELLELRETLKENLINIGVFALKTIPKDVILGPFEGISAAQYDKMNMWKMKGRKLANIKGGNWMQFLTIGMTADDKNLDAFQFNGNIYFQTNRDICEAEELVIFYNEYKRKISNTDKEGYYIPGIAEKSEKVYACTLCCLGFSSDKCLLEHKSKCWRSKYMQNTEKEIVECDRCKIWLEKQEHSEHHLAVCTTRKGRITTILPSRIDRSEIIAQIPPIVERTPSPKKTPPPAPPTKEFSLKCHLCSYQTNHKTKLRAHFDTHSDVKRFNCDICGTKFKHKCSLVGHMKHQHPENNEKKFKCEQCPYRTNRKNHFESHLNTHRDVKQFECHICLMQFKHKCSLKTHLRDQHTDGAPKNYKCPDCDYETNRKTHFQLHLNTHKEIKQYQCDVCGMRFKHKGSLKTHLEIKHPKEDSLGYQCTDCNYQTNCKRYLKNHITNMHTERLPAPKKFKCNQCEYRTTRKILMKCHIRNKHTIQLEKDFKCSACSYESNRKGDLMMHVKNKHMEGVGKDFMCPDCPFETNYRSYWRFHLINKHHQEEIPKEFHCMLCPFQTDFKRNLFGHIQTMHNLVEVPKIENYPQQPFVSDKNARQSNQNEEKQKLNKKFKCLKCKYRTKYKRNLKLHLRFKHRSSKLTKKSYEKVRNVLQMKVKHPDDVVKNLKCSHCVYRTHYKIFLRKHLKCEHRKEFLKDYKCSKCLYETFHKNNLRIHVRKKHGVVEIEKKVSDVNSSFDISDLLSLTMDLLE